MKLVYGLTATLIGTTMLGGAAAAASDKGYSEPPPLHAHFSAGHGHNPNGTPSSTPQQLQAQPQQAPVQGGKGGANTAPNFTSHYSHNGNWNGQHQHGSHNAGTTWTGGFRWNPDTLHDHNLSHWSAQDRTNWQHGQWKHERHNGRDGWWWYTNGDWFFYDQPIYPYPGYVSDYYYSDEYDDAYPDNGDEDDETSAPDQGGYYWYYCNDPAGYYPYVKSCRGPWRAVSPTPPGAQQGYDQNQPPDADDDNDQGPPPGYSDNGQPGSQYDGPDDHGPPQGYDNGQDDDDDNGPPPPPPR